jgi:hypothetical protein
VTEPTLTPAAFAAKWKGIETSEKASAQSHFIDLCRMLGEPTPHEADPIGSQFAFEKRVVKAGGGDGFADVWKRDFFAWEYKGKYKDLRAAYVQLLNYKDDLGNPPLTGPPGLEGDERGGQDGDGSGDLVRREVDLEDALTPDGEPGMVAGERDRLVVRTGHGGIPVAAP